MSIFKRGLGLCEPRHDRRSAKPLHEGPVLIRFEGLKYHNENLYYHKKTLVLKRAILYQDYFRLGKLRTIKGAVTLYASAGYKLRFSL